MWALRLPKTSTKSASPDVTAQGRRAQDATGVVGEEQQELELAPGQVQLHSGHAHRHGSDVDDQLADLHDPVRIGIDEHGGFASQLGHVALRTSIISSFWLRSTEQRRAVCVRSPSGHGQRPPADIEPQTAAKWKRSRDQFTGRSRRVRSSVPDGWHRPVRHHVRGPREGFQCSV